MKQLRLVYSLEQMRLVRTWGFPKVDVKVIRSGWLQVAFSTNQHGRNDTQGHHLGRGQWNPTSASHYGSEQAIDACLRQADDPLPAQYLDVGGNQRSADYYHSS